MKNAARSLTIRNNILNLIKKLITKLNVLQSKVNEQAEKVVVRQIKVARAKNDAKMNTAVKEYHAAVDALAYAEGSFDMAYHEHMETREAIQAFVTAQGVKNV